MFISSVDDSWAYFEDTGEIIFAGKNTQYYGMSNIDGTMAGGGSGTASASTLSVDDDYAQDYRVSTLSLVTDESASVTAETGLDAGFAAAIEQAKNAWMLEANGSEREVLIFPSQKRFNMTAKFTVSMHLKNGKNTLKLFNPIGTRADSAMLQYVNMGRQLKKATEKVARDAGKPEKPITFSICEWGFNQPYKWGRYAGNLWRTTPDIRPIWPWIKILYNHTVKLYKYAGVGGWNDPDMLEVGNGKLTFEQNRSHFALWCMMCAPLILGNDLRNISDDVLKIVKNPDLIAINQDALGVPAKRVVKGTVDVLVKPLADGSVAVCAFNKGGKKKYNLNLKKVLSDEYARCKKTENFVATNLWDKSETTTNGVLSVSINKHDSAVFIVR